MSLIQMLVKEMQQEAQTTQKMLERVPNDKYDWQPHPKSMTIRQLTTHIAELPSWVTLALTTDELDFATSPYSPKTINNTTELLEFFEQSWPMANRHLVRLKMISWSLSGRSVTGMRFTAKQPKAK